MEIDDYTVVPREIEGFVYLLVWHDARVVFGGCAEDEPQIAAEHHLDVLRQGQHENNKVQEVFHRHGEPDVETHHIKFSGTHSFNPSKVNERVSDPRLDSAAFLLSTAARKSYPRYTWHTAEGLNVQPVLATPDVMKPPESPQHFRGTQLPHTQQTPTGSTRTGLTQQTTESDVTMNTPQPGDDGLKLPVALSAPPQPEFEGEYQKFADDLWIWTEYLYSGDGTVASLSWEGDRPGGADNGYIERYEDRYVFWILNVDIWEDLGRFVTTAEAIKSWRDRFEQADYPPAITLQTANWVGPIPD